MSDSNAEKPYEDKNEKEDQECNIFRQTYLRYLGYAGHLSWLCPSLFPHPIITTLGSVAYVCADAMREYSAASERGVCQEEIQRSTASVFLWHLLASFTIPGVFLFGVNRTFHQLLPGSSKCPPRPSLWPCILTSFTIPFMVGPIDGMVDRFMNDNLIKTKGFNSNCNTIEEERKSCKVEPDVKPKSSSKWFFERSRDQGDLELERHKNKSSQISVGIQVGRSKININPSPSTSKMVQVDKTTRPRLDDKEAEEKNESKPEERPDEKSDEQPDANSDENPERQP